MTQPDEKRFPYGCPSQEYMRAKGLNKPQDFLEAGEASTHDVLCALLLSADAVWDELRRIRVMMEDKLNPSTSERQA